MELQGHSAGRKRMDGGAIRATDVEAHEHIAKLEARVVALEQEAQRLARSVVVDERVGALPYRPGVVRLATPWTSEEAALADFIRRATGYDPTATATHLTFRPSRDEETTIEVPFLKDKRHRIIALRDAMLDVRRAFVPREGEPLQLPE